jgi:hypothetical protein
MTNPWVARYLALQSEVVDDVPVRGDEAPTSSVVEPVAAPRPVRRTVLTREDKALSRRLGEYLWTEEELRWLLRDETLPHMLDAQIRAKLRSGVHGGKNTKKVKISEDGLPF